MVENKNNANNYIQQNKEFRPCTYISKNGIEKTYTYYATLNDWQTHQYHHKIFLKKYYHNEDTKPTDFDKKIKTLYDNMYGEENRIIPEPPLRQLLESYPQNLRIDDFKIKV